MKRFLDGFSKLVEAVCVTIMVLMVIVVFVATIGRYSKLYAIDWSDEFARYSMVAIVYLGLMLASRNGGHFVVEVVPMIFPKSVVKAISVVSPMMDLPLGMVYLLIPVGVGLMAVFYTIHTIESLMAKDEKKEGI